jgi:precorrin-6B methylase 2
MVIWGIIIYILILAAAAGFIVVALWRVFFLYLVPIISGGAFFAKSRNETIKNTIEMAELEKTAEAEKELKIVDLGSGDGALVIELSKIGFNVYGFEISPYLVWLSKKNIKRAGLEGRAFILRKNLWKEDLSQFDVVFIFGIKYMMKNLEEKLQKELKPGTKVISNYLTFPGWKYSAKKDDVYLYIK